MENRSYLQKTGVVTALALLCCFLWGSAFSCIKIGYELFKVEADDTWAQILFAGIRFTLGGILVIAAGSCIQKKMIRPKKTSWGMVFRICLCQTVIQYFFFYIGLAHTTGVRASIIEGANIFMAILIASMLYHQEKLTASKAAGCLIGFAGVVLVNLSGGSLAGAFSFSGEGFILISNLSYAFSSVLMKAYTAKEAPVVLSGYQFVMGGLIMTAAAFAMGGRLNGVSPAAAAMLIYLAMVSAVAYTIWGILLKYNPVSKVTVFTFTTPIFGVILSAVLLRESSQLPWIQSAAALALVCIGIFIVNRAEVSALKEEKSCGV